MKTQSSGTSSVFLNSGLPIPQDYSASGSQGSAATSGTAAGSSPAAVGKQQAGYNATDASLTSQRESGIKQQQQGMADVQGLQDQQQAAYGVATNATNTAASNAANTAAPGQDIFSKKLASMANGQFSADDPSYQWRLQQGQQAVERSAAAKGQLGSGNVLTALTDYAQGAASQEYGAQFNRMLQGSQNATQQYGQAYNSLSQMLSGQNASAGTGVQLANAAQGQQQIGLGLMGATTQQGQLGISQGQLGVSQGQLGVAQGSLALQQSQFAFQKEQSQVGKSIGYSDLNAQDKLANQSKGADAAVSSLSGNFGSISGNRGLNGGSDSGYVSPFSMVYGQDYNSGDDGYGFSGGGGSSGSSVGAGDLISGGLANQGWSNAGAPISGFSSGGE